VEVGSGVRLYPYETAFADVDDYQFAGNGYVIFTNDSGSLFSTPVDGSRAPFEVSPRLGQAVNDGNNLAVTWQVIADGHLFYADPSGTHLTGPDGHGAILVDPDWNMPSCGIFNDGIDTCASSGEGNNVLLHGGEPSTIVSGGLASTNPNYLANTWHEVLSLDDPAGPKTRILSGQESGLYRGDGSIVHYELDSSLVRLAPDGSRIPLLEPNTGSLWRVDLSEWQISSDLRWAFIQEIVPGQVTFADGCINCIRGEVVSLDDGTRWTPSDENGPLGMWGLGFSPNGSRLLIVGPVLRTASRSTGAGGTLYLVPASGGTLQVVDQNVDAVTWVDDHHAVVERYVSHGDYPAGTFVRTFP
jgi:hypothetical protein